MARWIKRKVEVGNTIDQMKEKKIGQGPDLTVDNIENQKTTEIDQRLTINNIKDRQKTTLQEGMQLHQQNATVNPKEKDQDLQMKKPKETILKARK